MVILPLAIQLGVTETGVGGDVLSRLDAKKRNVALLALFESRGGEVHRELPVCRPVLFEFRSDVAVLSYSAPSSFL